MAVRTFAVSANETSRSSFGIITTLGALLVAAAAIRVPAQSQWKVAAIGCLVMLVLFEKTRKQRAVSSCQATIVVYPLGVQLGRIRDDRPVGAPLFIPHDAILDVIVNEVILAHKVVSIVLFRIWKQEALRESRDASDKPPPPPISFLLKEGRIHLDSAFPGVEMSYAECQMMRRELSNALGLK